MGRQGESLREAGGEKNLERGIDASDYGGCVNRKKSSICSGWKMKIIKKPHLESGG